MHPALPRCPDSRRGLAAGNSRLRQCCVHWSTGHRQPEQAGRADAAQRRARAGEHSAKGAAQSRCSGVRMCGFKRRCVSWSSDFSSSPVAAAPCPLAACGRFPLQSSPVPHSFSPNLKFISLRAARPLPWDRERVGGPKSCADNRFAFTGNILGSGDSGMLTSGGVPSPTDRIQILSQPRPSSTPTARSVPSVANPVPTVSQPDQWQPQHTGYSTTASSPLEASVLSDISGPPDTVRWSPHPHSHQHSTSLPVPDSPLHAVDSSHLPYSYVLDTSGRPMQYQMESQPMVSQPMSGYGTPTSNPSPHPPEFQRHLTIQLATAQQPQYSSYSTHSHHGYLPTSTHPGEMAMMPQPMMGEQGHIMYHMNPNMKSEQH